MNSDERYALKLNIAKLYYEQKLTQAEITERLNVSRPTLIKLMKEAQEEGIVRIEICDIRKMTEYRVIENQLKQVLGLKDAKIVGANSDNMDKMSQAIGEKSTEFILKYFESGMKVGVGWGRTLEVLAASMESVKDVWDVSFSTILGGPGSAEDYTMFSNLLCERIASRFTGSSVNYLYAPLFVDSPVVRDAYVSLPNVKSALGRFDELDLALVGIDGDAEHSTTFSVEPGMERMFSPEEYKRIVGNVCSRFYDADGNMVSGEVEQGIIGISAKQLRNISTVIGLAGGTYKVDSIIGGAKAGLFNVLVTDVFTAKKILERH